MSVRTTLVKECYSWGELRVLRKSNDYTCVIHPEHLVAINEEKPFRDEQGYCWKPVITDGMVTLKNGNSRFTISLAELNA